MKQLNRTVSFAATALATVLLCTMISAGCGMKVGNKPTRIQLRSHESGRVYAKQFAEAYYSALDTGEYEIVLIDDGDGGADAGAGAGATLKHAKPGEPRRPLQPLRLAPLRQVVHIRMHWRPLRGTKPDHPSATNAVVDWYVTSPAGSSADDRLHYRGAAFVELNEKARVADIVISNGQLELVESKGSLMDPVGRSALAGSFVARKNPTMVAVATAPLRLDAAASRVRPARSMQPARESGDGAAGP